MHLLKILSLILLVSCGGSKVSNLDSESHTNLVNQRLSFRTGYTGYLTHRICTEYIGKVCSRYDIAKYNVMDRNVRAKLNSFRFACRVAGRRFRIDIDEPKLYRVGRCIKDCWYWHWKCCEHEYNWIPFKDNQYLVDAGTYCKAGI